MLNALYPPCPWPLKTKIARRAKCGEKLAKKAQLFTLELFKFPPPPPRLIKPEMINGRGTM